MCVLPLRHHHQLQCHLDWSESAPAAGADSRNGETLCSRHATEAQESRNHRVSPLRGLRIRGSRSGRDDTSNGNPSTSPATRVSACETKAPACGQERRTRSMLMREKTHQVLSLWVGAVFGDVVP